MTKDEDVGDIITVVRNTSSEFLFDSRSKHTQENIFLEPKMINYKFKFLQKKNFLRSTELFQFFNNLIYLPVLQP